MKYTHAELANGFRQLADFIEAHPEFSHDYSGYVISNCGVGDTKENVRNCALAMGYADKEFTENGLLRLVKKFGPGLTHHVAFDRSAVSERVVVGTKEIPEHVITASAEMVIPSRTEEIVEWKCEPILMAVAHDR